MHHLLTGESIACSRETDRTTLRFQFFQDPMLKDYKMSSNCSDFVTLLSFKLDFETYSWTNNRANSNILGEAEMMRKMWHAFVNDSHIRWSSEMRSFLQQGRMFRDQVRKGLRASFSGKNNHLLLLREKFGRKMQFVLHVKEYKGRVKFSILLQEIHTCRRANNVCTMVNARQLSQFAGLTSSVGRWPFLRQSVCLFLKCSIASIIFFYNYFYLMDCELEWMHQIGNWSDHVKASL